MVRIVIFHIGYTMYIFTEAYTVGSEEKRDLLDAKLSKA